MPDHDTPDPSTILPPDIEAERQRMLAATKAALEARLGLPLSQEAYDDLLALITLASVDMLHFSNNPPVSWTTLDIPEDLGDPDA